MYNPVSHATLAPNGMLSEMIGRSPDPPVRAFSLASVGGHGPVNLVLLAVDLPFNH